MEFDLELPLVADSPSSLFLTETQHMPSCNYIQKLKSAEFDVSVRRRAIYSIIRYSFGFHDPSLTYLAINYLDRFLSTQELPSQNAWVIRLIAASCVSLAAKMKPTQRPVSESSVADEGLVFNIQTLKRMETVILGALKWRTRSVTPFSFLCFFMASFDLKDGLLGQTLKGRASQIILISQHDIKLLEFKPSAVAASALLQACHELFPLQYPCFRQSIFQCSYVNKESLMKCYRAIKEENVAFNDVSDAETLVNVLDLRFSGSESGVNAGASKKRKIQWMLSPEHPI